MRLRTRPPLLTYLLRVEPLPYNTLFLNPSTSKQA